MEDDVREAAKTWTRRASSSIASEVSCVIVFLWRRERFLATLRAGEESATVLIPDLTRHIDVVELISKEFLRERLSLRTATVTLTLTTS